MKKINKRELLKISILVFMLIICLFGAYYFHFILKTEIIFTHFFYVPIILSALWWSRKGVAVSLFLALVLLASHIISPLETLIRADILRAFMFVTIGVVVAILTEKRRILEGKLKSYSKNLEHQVEERTKEIKKHHIRLEELVKERTMELEEKTLSLKDANIKLKELDRLKSMFIASMSHELRTPLNSIIGFTGIILQGMSGEILEEQRKQLTMVKNSAKHLLALINDIIDVSKIEAGKIEPIIANFNLSGIMHEVKESFKIAAAEKGIELTLEIPESLVIKSDERRAKQVLMNLVSNAVKFTERGDIEIRLEKKDRSVEISVRDTGIGIKQEDMDKLFKPFSQIFVKGMPKQEGTGLGLYISKKIAGLLNCEISAASEFGKGSKFVFSLPLKYEEEKGNEKNTSS